MDNGGIMVSNRRYGQTIEWCKNILPQVIKDNGFFMIAFDDKPNKAQFYVDKFKHLGVELTFKSIYKDETKWIMEYDRWSEPIGGHWHTENKFKGYQFTIKS